MSVNKKIVTRNRGFVFPFGTGSYLSLHLCFNNPFTFTLFRQHTNVTASRDARTGFTCSRPVRGSPWWSVCWCYWPVACPLTVASIGFLCQPRKAVGAMLPAALLVVSGIGCGAAARRQHPPRDRNNSHSRKQPHPALLPAGGTFTGSQSVAISDNTMSATIYYAPDGTAPTAASLLYSGPISLNSTTTVHQASRGG